MTSEINGKFTELVELQAPTLGLGSFSIAVLMLII